MLCGFGAAAILVALSYACMYGRYGQWLDDMLNGASPSSWGKRKGGMPVRALPRIAPCLAMSWEVFF